MMARKRHEPPGSEERSAARAQKRRFRESTDAVTEALGIRLSAVSRGFGVSTHRLARWRDEEDDDSAPDCWRETLAGFVAGCVAERRRQASDGELLVRLLRATPERSAPECGATGDE